MPHKVATEEAIREVEERIRFHLESIKHSSLWREDRDRDSFKFLLKSLKEHKEVARSSKDTALRSFTDQGFRFAAYCLGKEETIKDLIESFEDVDSWEKHHKEEIQSLERELASLKSKFFEPGAKNL